MLFDLALRLGLPAGELAGRMTSREITCWMAYLTMGEGEQSADEMKRVLMAHARACVRG